jgi:hypothetical protein
VAKPRSPRQFAHLSDLEADIHGSHKTCFQRQTRLRELLN